MIRLPVVADRFYPGNPRRLSETIAALGAARDGGRPATVEAIALVAPHAGYIYSGAVAAETFQAVTIPESVILLGPNHTGLGLPIALSAATWRMPLGDVPPDRTLITELLAEPTLIRLDEEAHRHEHSLEVQLPFLQTHQPRLELAAICLSTLSFAHCQEIGATIARAVQRTGKKVLIVASSDMTHYEPRTAASRKDHLALDHIGQMNPKGLYDYVTSHRVSMCGYIPVTIALISATLLGARRSNLIRYSDSGEASGDTNQVVGYAGVTIC